MAELRVKVVPGSSRNQIAGWHGGGLRIKVQAPAENGKANRAVIELLAEATNMPRTSLSISSGETSPHKVICWEGVTDEHVRELLEVYLGENRGS